MSCTSEESQRTVGTAQVSQSKHSQYDTNKVALDGGVLHLALGICRVFDLRLGRRVLVALLVVGVLLHHDNAK